MSDLTRRELLSRAAVYGGGAVVALYWPRAARAAAESTKPVILSAQEWKTVEAMTARILPSDDGSPGGREAGCVNFIDKALANEEAAARPLYAKGIRGLDATARAQHPKPFAELDPTQQDALLAALEDGKPEGWPADVGDPAGFFETVRTHTLLGFLSDPKYGGNRDFVGWKLTGYPGPRHIRNGYTPAQLLGKTPIRAVWGEDI